jgi:hypothetical protein
MRICREIEFANPTAPARRARRPSGRVRFGRVRLDHEHPVIVGASARPDLEDSRRAPIQLVRLARGRVRVHDRGPDEHRAHAPLSDVRALSTVTGGAFYLVLEGKMRREEQS